MKLPTKEIENQLSAFGSTKHIVLSEKQVVCISAIEFDMSTESPLKDRIGMVNFICFSLIPISLLKK